MATRFATANAAQPSSTCLCRAKSITRMADGLDRRFGAQLLPQAADADLDDVRARIEVQAPDRGEEPLAADDLAGPLGEMVEEAELAIGQRRHALAEAGLAAGEIERERARAEDAFTASPRLAEVDA